jgi:hypothetical protein
MAQIRTTRYHSPDTSRNQNLQLAGLVRPGVYSGYKVVPATEGSNRLSIVKGAAVSSILVTEEGVRIEETEDLNSVTQVTNANPDGVRIDLVVARYQFTADNNVGQTYEVIRGAYPTSGQDPVAPLPTAFQIPLAHVKVNAKAGSASIYYSDVINLIPARFTPTPELGSLKPIIDSARRSRIFVYEGYFPSFDGTEAISFPGGYSRDLVLDDFDAIGVRYALFGVADDLVVSVIGTATTVDQLPAFTNSILPLCIATVSVTAVGPVIESIKDIRFPVSRQLVAVVEDEPYKASLADSVFDYVRVDVFRDSEGIELSTLAVASPTNSFNETANSSLTTAPWLLTVDKGRTALNLAGNDTVINGYAVFVTKDLFRDVSFKAQHFMVHVDADFPLISFRYSTSSPSAGFSSPMFAPGQIVRIPAGEIQKLYLKFYVPAEYVNRTNGCNMFSFGCYLRLNQQVVNTATVSDVGVRSLKNSVPNLIANGNFRAWSRNDINGSVPNPDLIEEIVYQLSDARPYAADGWQFLSLGAVPVNNTISRVSIQTDIVGSGVGTDTGLYWEVGPNQASTNVSEMEYRAPISGAEAGKFVTFALSYRASSSNLVAINVAIYRLTPTGGVQRELSNAVAAPTASGRLIVRSRTPITIDAVAIGFIVQFIDRTGNVTVYNATGALGEFASLDYTEPVNAGDILRKYYERGRIVAAGNTLEGQQVAATVQFGAQKFTQLGALYGEVVPGSAYNRSFNVNAPVFDVTKDGMTVIASSLSNGLAKVDLDFESYIRY